MDAIKFNDNGSIDITLSKLYKAKMNNDARARDIQRTMVNNPGIISDKGLSECRATNNMILEKIQKLEAYIAANGLQKPKQPIDDMMYMLDPSIKNDDSMKEETVKMDPNMYMINPNKAFYPYSSAEETYMIRPKSNVPVIKKIYQQKDTFRIYPHMYQQYNVLQEMQDAEDNGTNRPLVNEGANYPIQKNFELTYLQDPPRKGPKYLDYDMIEVVQPTKLPTGNAYDYDYQIAMNTEGQLRHTDPRLVTDDIRELERIKLKELKQRQQLVLQQQQFMAQANKRAPTIQGNYGQPILGPNYN